MGQSSQQPLLISRPPQFVSFVKGANQWWKAFYLEGFILGQYTKSKLKNKNKTLNSIMPCLPGSMVSPAKVFVFADVWIRLDDMMEKHPPISFQLDDNPFMFGDRKTPIHN